MKSLNPFHTGRGLSTLGNIETIAGEASLNPFHTGRGLSTGMNIRKTISAVKS